MAGERAGIGTERPAASVVVVSMAVVGSMSMLGAVAARVASAAPCAAAGRIAGAAVNAEQAATSARRQKDRIFIGAQEINEVVPQESIF